MKVDSLKSVRPAAVAGRFYPSDPAELRVMVDGFLARVSLEEVERAPKALIVPHAGYPYSGPIAASAYARLGRFRAQIRRVVLVGPAHFVPFRGIALSSAAYFETPLGLVSIDVDSTNIARTLHGVEVFDEAHTREHSLEVQLPFLQLVLGDFSVLPAVTGDSSHAEVEDLFDKLWGGPETVLIVSSDLSHYYESQVARRLDQATAEAIRQLKPDDVLEEQACGRLAICGLLRAVRKRGLEASVLDLRNSGDTAGPRNQVVGYGAFGFS
jgi:AmmeMemoRadiSam system protein B